MSSKVFPNWVEPLENIIDVKGSAPIPPIAKDFITAMGRTNDAILYGGEVHLNVKGKDDELENLAKNLHMFSPLAELVQLMMT